MGTISRQLPKSNVTRRRALVAAYQKLLNPGPNGTIISPNTTVRLSGIHPQYVDGYNLVLQRQAESSAQTANKNATLRQLRLFVKHFVGVFNMGIERRLYTPEQRSYFGIAVDNSNLPVLTSEVEVVELAQLIVTNDPLRVAAGGAPMANPSTADVQAQLDVYLPLAAATSNTRDALDNAQEALEALATEADGVIKKVWDEVETFYNEESPESQRENCREWGVVYVTVGAKATLNFQVTTTDEIPLPIADAEVKQSETGVIKLTNAEGRTTIETTTSGNNVVFEVSAAGYVTQIVELSFSEGETLSTTVRLLPG